MAFCVLVLHGPNLSLLAAEEIDPRLEARASELGVELLVVQSNGEQGLLDALHAEADKADAILVNPGALAPMAFALAEGLQMLNLPVVEVLLKTLVPERGPSSLTGVVKQQVHGLGVDGYVRGLELLVPEGKPAMEQEEEEQDEVEAPKGKSIGRKQAAPVGKSIGRKATASAPEAPAVKGKTIGRGAAPEKKAPVASVPTTTLTRSQVSERIKRRLKGQETAEVLAQWARDTWTGLQRGAGCEAGAKDTIESVLLTLMAGAKANDAMLVAQMAKLDR